MKKDKLIYEMTEEEIKEKIKKNLVIRNEEKNKYGEVFTPEILIEEILNNLPNEVWYNLNYKWLEPSNGIGNFSIIIYSKLMKSLKNKIKDDVKRSNHIIKNMLYMIELNPDNVNESVNIFGKDANIYCGSFLDDDWKKVFNVHKFDVIVGNPPWNDEKQDIQKGSRAKNSLWDIFVKESLKILNVNGYLGFINPSHWRGLGKEYHKIWNILTEKQLLYLHIYSKTDSKKYFNLIEGNRFDLYVLKNNENLRETEVIDELGNKNLIDMSKWNFLPNYNYDIFEKILTSEEKGINVIMSYGAYFVYKSNNNISKVKTNKFKYPVVHSVRKDGIVYWYSNTNKNGHFGEPKVILNFNEKQYSHPHQNDYKGELGMSQISFGLPIKSKKEGDEILKVIDTDEFKKVIASTKWSTFQTDWRMFKYFKPDFYKYFLKKNKKITKRIRKKNKRITNKKK